jgi:hypothetical protein
MTKQVKTAVPKIGKAIAKAASQIAPAANLEARRAARIEANSKLVRRVNDKIVDAPMVDVTSQVADSISNHSEAERIVAIAESAKPDPMQYATEEAYVEACKAAAPIETDSTVVATIEQPKAKAEAPAAEELAPAVSIEVPTRLLRAALSVAGKDDSRYYLNGVRIHQTPDGQTRVVATDGCRLLVANFTLESAIDWAREGVTVPTEQLTRMLRYFGKDAAMLDVSFGVGHQHMIFTAPGDGGSFKVAPIDGQYPDYQKVMDSGAEAFTAERDGVAAPMIDPAYLKSASQVAAAFESEGIQAHTGSSNAKTPVVFTFQGVDSAVLYIMPKTVAADYSLPDATVKMYGRGAMKKTVEDLRESAKHSRNHAKKCKHEKFKKLSIARAERLEAQADAIEAANSVKIAGPKASAESVVAAAVATARAVTTASVH